MNQNMKTLFYRTIFMNFIHSIILSFCESSLSLAYPSNFILNLCVVRVFYCTNKFPDFNDTKPAILKSPMNSIERKVTINLQHTSTDDWWLHPTYNILALSHRCLKIYIYLIQIIKISLALLDGRSFFKVRIFLFCWNACSCFSRSHNNFV